MLAGWPACNYEPAAVPVGASVPSSIRRCVADVLNRRPIDSPTWPFHMSTPTAKMMTRPRVTSCQDKYTHKNSDSNKNKDGYADTYSYCN